MLVSVGIDRGPGSVGWPRVRSPGVRVAGGLGAGFGGTGTGRGVGSGFGNGLAGVGADFTSGFASAGLAGGLASDFGSSGLTSGWKVSMGLSGAAGVGGGCAGVARLFMMSCVLITSVCLPSILGTAVLRRVSGFAACEFLSE